MTRPQMANGQASTSSGHAVAGEGEPAASASLLIPTPVRLFASLFLDT